MTYPQIHWLRWTLLGAIGGPVFACGGQLGDGLDPDESGGSNSGGRASGGSTSGDGGSESGGGPSGSGGTTEASGGAQGGFSCTNPWDHGGFVSCEEGYTHRERVAACENELPRPDRIFEKTDESPGSCEYDSDCEGELEYCRVGSAMGLALAYCVSGCLTDSDCSEGQICACGSGPVGSCVAAECQSDADCAMDMRCSSWKTYNGCSTTLTYSCQTEDDSCLSHLYCSGDEECRVEDGKRACHPQEITCQEGRPFLIAGQLRRAPVQGRSDWQENLRVAVGHLDEPSRSAVGAHFLRAAQMEHASIAAFARFSLQLLSLGAPASLIESTTRAMEDETRHARLCFGMASVYLGREVGPGPLSIEGALSDQSLENIVRTAIIEGCVGETLAALELARAAEIAQEEGVAHMLADISSDEARHAELAFRFVAWVITMHPQLASLVAEELAQVRALAQGVGTEGGRASKDEPDPARRSLDLARFGVFPAAEKKRLREVALVEVIAPCLEQLLGSSKSLGRLSRQGGESRGLGST